MTLARRAVLFALAFLLVVPAVLAGSLTCAVCGQPIKGSYYHNDWGDYVCARHLSEYPPCEYCGRLTAPQLTGQAKRYPDGRIVCGNCLKTAVTSAAAADSLLQQVRQTLSRFGITIDRHPDLKLVSKTEMARIGPTARADLRGFAELRERTGLLGIVRDRQLNIYALAGMPHDILLAVLAHELMHVWMFTHVRWNTDDALAEGSCEYAAYLALKDVHTGLAKYYLDYMNQRDDPVYGLGYRRVTAFVEKVGISGWLAYLQKNATPPWP